MTANISKTVNRSVTCQMGRNIGSTSAFQKCIACDGSPQESPLDLSLCFLQRLMTSTCFIFNWLVLLHGPPSGPDIPCSPLIHSTVHFPSRDRISETKQDRSIVTMARSALRRPLVFSNVEKYVQVLKRFPAWFWRRTVRHSWCQQSATVRTCC